MEILQFLTNFFIEQFKDSSFTPILCLLKDNCFDLRKTFANLSPQTVAPIIQAFMSMANNKSPTETVGQSSCLKPIENIANSEIVSTLNTYFCQ